MKDVLEGLLQAAPYSLEKTEKQALYRQALSDLTRHHYNA